MAKTVTKENGLLASKLAFQHSTIDINNGCQHENGNKYYEFLSYLKQSHATRYGKLSFVLKVLIAYLVAIQNISV